MIRKTGGQQAHEILGEVFKKYDKQKRFTMKDFDELKAAYVAKYGYQSAVPDFGDIVHTKLPGLMSARKKRLEDQTSSTNFSLIGAGSGSIIRLSHDMDRHGSGRDDGWCRSSALTDTPGTQDDGQIRAWSGSGAPGL